MIDIHCHILPGIDDGPSDMLESVEMARMAFHDGITTIVATPHVRDALYPAGIIREGVNALNGRLGDLGVPVTILSGADVNALLDPSFLKAYTIQGTDYILFEFPHSHLPYNAREILFAVATRGFRPIITHPERNPSIVRNPDLLFDLLDLNPLVQLTAGSLTGEFGAEIRECAVHLLRKGIASFLATDAHSSRGRRPVLSEGLRVAEKIMGKEKASHLVTSNPEAVINGRPLDVTHRL